MAKNTDKVVLNSDALGEMIDNFATEASLLKRQMELDARVLRRLHTFYGHRPAVPGQAVVAATRRMQNILRGL